nr:MAG TPA: hypothetical protein [Caudoviricetes sp.]
MLSNHWNQLHGNHQQCRHSLHYHLNRQLR